jgi:putative ABC transport system ATP-binding protein
MPNRIQRSPRALFPDEQPAVICREVTKDFRSGDGYVRALSGVHFQANFGEITLLIGPSGCGKTTLLSVIGGLLDKSGGYMETLGVDADQLKDTQSVMFRRENIGFVFQQYNLLPSLTAAENAAVPLLAAGVKRKTAVSTAASMLERLGVGERARAYPNQLSGGQQQRVAIARALVHEPRLLVCDEPTAALDEDSGRAVMDLLREAAVRPDRAVIVVTHDARVFGFGDRIAHMNDGRITKTETNKGRPGGQPYGPDDRRTPMYR